MKEMALDQEHKSLITFDRAVATIGVVVALVGYFRPPDPTHPATFDFLSRTLSIPFWLASLIVVGVFVSTSAVTEWIIKHSLQNSAADVETPDIPPVSILPRETDRDMTPPRAIGVPPASKIPPRLGVKISTVQIDEDTSVLAMILHNSGGSAALHIHIGDVQLSRFTIRFSGDIPTLAPGASARPVRPAVVEYPESRKHEIGQAMYESVSTRSSQGDDSQFEGTATFYDTNGKEYRATWIYTFFRSRFRATTLPEPPDDDEEIGPYLTVSEVSTEAVGQNYRGNWR